MSLMIKQVYGLALIQDQGRHGFYDYGVTTGGAMDCDSHNMANAILDNKKNAATIELSLATLVAVIKAPMQLCLTGAESELKVNGKRVSMWHSFAVNVGDVIEINLPKIGCRSYLAVKSGFNTTAIFGSRSTVVREGLGGVNGGVLTHGDEIPVQSDFDYEELILKPNKSCARQFIPDVKSEVELRVVMGYQSDLFNDVQKQLFFSSCYEVSHQSDRMGYRLRGQPIKCDSYKLASEGICLGAIQIPADGQPIVLMRDRQTIGGYPKIGAVLSVDLNLLSQSVAGSRIRFTPITVEDAHNAIHRHEFWLNKRTQSIKTRPISY